jgi:predicted aspartyl protease
MVIRYAYFPYGARPAPFVHATIRCPQTGARTEEVPAQVDTGAETSILPGALARSLGLAQMGAVSVAGFGGLVSTVPTFSAEIAIRSLEPVLVKVLASEGEEFVILGRDVLNRFRIVLDGPRSALEIE